ncbi:major capsid protein [uncultured Bacteroides sp.]|uniref:major capsid protein n=1 Tax=uncultured Bacteroides sp. TaxID=162156 RepID=UPI00374A964A
MGQMNAPVFNVTQTDLEVEVNSYKPGNGLIWPVLFPLKYTSKMTLDGISGEDGIPVTADRVAFNTKSPKKTRKTVGSWHGRLGKISISRDKDENDINDYNEQSAIAQSGLIQDKAAAQYLVDMVYDDVKFCSDGMDYRVELDALRIGSSGMQVTKEEIDGDTATDDVINFNIPTENYKGVTAIAGTANADTIKDIAAAQKAISKKGLKKPMFAIVETETMELILSEASLAKKVASTILSIAGLEQANEISVGVVNAYMQKHGYPQFVVIDSYATVEHKDGTKETLKPWNANVITLSPTVQLGWTYYKPVPMVKDTAALQAQGSYFKTTIYSEVNPMLETTMAEAYIQPALINRASLVFINAKKTTWNNGEV